MGRGPGRVERSIMPVFEAAPDEIIDTVEIAGRALGKQTISESEASSYRRALRRLAARRDLVDMGRRWRDGRRRYALPQRAQQHDDALVNLRQALSSKPSR